MVEEAVVFIKIGTPADSTDGLTTTHLTYLVAVQVGYVKDCDTVKTRVYEPRGLRTFWQKFAFSIPLNIRTC